MTNPWILDVTLAIPRRARRHGRRELIGIAWELSSAPAVVVSTVFTGYPAAGALFAGDEILTVNDEPVRTYEDVVFHWERSSSGADVRFQVRRRASHLVGIRAATMIQWVSTMTPLVAGVRRLAPASPNDAESTDRDDAQELLPGDLVVAIGGEPMALPAQVDVALARRPSELASSDIAVLRGCELPGEADESCNACACLWRTRVPRPAMKTRTGAEGVPQGAPLLEFA